MSNITYSIGGRVDELDVILCDELLEQFSLGRSRTEAGSKTVESSPDESLVAVCHEQVKPQQLLVGKKKQAQSMTPRTFSQ
jgi:hypothetical protein